MNEIIYEASQLLSGADVFRSLEPPAQLAVFGDPIAHSKSPLFQNAALRSCGLPIQYVKIHVRSEELSDALKALPAAGFLGANVTIPHKGDALATVDEVDDYARKSGAVNTVVVEGERLIGFNTDGPGLLRALREEFYVDLRDLRVLLLGAGGGAGRAIAVQCAFESCERLVLVNRTFEKAKKLASELSPYFRSDRLVGPAERIEAIPFDERALREQLAKTDLVINATSVGMRRTDPRLIPAGLLTANLMVYDTVYAAGKSRLIEDAEAAGARATNGLSMLLHQGALSFEIWFGRAAPLEVMRAALKAAP
ncbi:MAG TPA: shikimate dehydrogenase [Terrimicrobiaceae bacterium]|nr:shikimate dehydrogenase [Terrimicrobiaceae bacterium]